MANAGPLQNDRSFESLEDEISEDDTDTATSKQNGVGYRHVDRYGFIGGNQYTNPDE